MPQKPATPQKKWGTLPVEGGDEEKRTNEIGMTIALLEGCDLAGKDVTGDALLTQRALARHIVERQAHYHFTAKGNQRVLAVNRGHWPIESVHYLIDWNNEEDRIRIGPENITRLRRFTIGILKSFQKPTQSIAGLMLRLCFRTRFVFDYLRMMENSVTGSRAS